MISFGVQSRAAVRRGRAELQEGSRDVVCRRQFIAFRRSLLPVVGTAPTCSLLGRHRPLLRPPTPRS